MTFPWSYSQSEAEGGMQGGSTPTRLELLGVTLTRAILSLVIRGLKIV